MLAQSIIHALSLEETDRRPCDMESKLWAAINRYDRLAQNNDHRKNNEEERARLFKLLRDFLCENKIPILPIKGVLIQSPIRQTKFQVGFLETRTRTIPDSHEQTLVEFQESSIVNKL